MFKPPTETLISEKWGVCVTLTGLLQSERIAINQFSLKKNTLMSHFNELALQAEQKLQHLGLSHSLSKQPVPRLSTWTLNAVPKSARRCFCDVRADSCRESHHK